ncbi:hypothetical protein BH11PLA1_BH11PLA1_09830 [soil metagenome]
MTQAAAQPAAALQAAQDALAGAQLRQGEGATPMAIPNFAAAQPGRGAAPMDLLGDVNLNVKIELGRTRMLVEDVLRLGEGSVVELEKLAGDPVDVYVNERHVARGEVLVLNDNFCVRISEILSTLDDERKAS